MFPIQTKVGKVRPLLSIFPLLFASLITPGLTTGCGDSLEKLYQTYHDQVASVGDIDDRMVKKYIKTYRELRKHGLNLSRSLAGKDGELNEADLLESYKKIETLIKAGGFEDYAEFIKVNAKIAWA